MSGKERPTPITTTKKVEGPTNTGTLLLTVMPEDY